MRIPTWLGQGHVSVGMVSIPWVLSEADVETRQGSDECGCDDEEEERRKNADHQWKRQSDREFASRSFEVSPTGGMSIRCQLVDHSIEWNTKPMSGLECIDQRTNSLPERALERTQ